MIDQKANNTVDFHQKIADENGLPHEVAKSINFTILYGSDFTEKPLFKLYKLLRSVGAEIMYFDGPNKLIWDEISIVMESPTNFGICDNVAFIQHDNMKRAAETAIRLHYNIVIDKMIKAIYQNE